MRYDCIIYDFDGTIADTSEGVLESVEYAFNNMGKTAPPREQLYCFIGPTLYDTFTQRFNFTHAEAMRAIELYREHYRPVGVYKLALFGGMKELFDKMRAAGVKQCVASSKPQNQLLVAVAHLGLTEYFEKIIGPDPSKTESDKSDLFTAAKVGNSAIVVGDSKFDILGAHKAGLPAVAVTYGFGDKQELRSAAPEYTADTPYEVAEYLLKD